MREMFSPSGWRVWIGIGGGFELEQVAVLNQNEWRFSLEYAFSLGFDQAELQTAPTAITGSEV